MKRNDWNFILIWTEIGQEHYKMWSAFRAKSKFLSLAFKGQSLVPTLLSPLLLRAFYVLTIPDISLLLNICIKHSPNFFSRFITPSGILFSLSHPHLCYQAKPQSFSKYITNDQSNLRPFQNSRQIWTSSLPVSSLSESCFYVCFKNLHTLSSVHSTAWLLLSTDAKYLDSWDWVFSPECQPSD